MSDAIVAHYRRCTFTATMKDSDGNNISVSGKTVRCKIGPDGATPLIDLTSAAATANGSTISAANPTTIVLSSTDLVPSIIQAGVWPCEFCLTDNLQNNQIVRADVARLVVHQAGTGLGV